MDGETNKPGAHPNKDNSIRFPIQSKFICLCLFLHHSNHKEILHIPRQHICVEMYKISLWLDQFSLNYSEDKYHLLTNWIESLVGCSPVTLNNCDRHLFMNMESWRKNYHMEYQSWWRSLCHTIIIYLERLFNFLRFRIFLSAYNLILWATVWQLIFTMKPKGKFNFHLWLKIGNNRIQREISNDSLTQTQFECFYWTKNLYECSRNYIFHYKLAIIPRRTLLISY